MENMSNQNAKNSIADEDSKKTGGSKTKSRKKVVNSKPVNYKETEQLAKKLLNAEGTNYYEWLDKLHKEVIFEKMLANQESIINAIED